MDPQIEFVNALLAKYRETIGDLLNENVILKTQLGIANAKLAEASLTSPEAVKPTKKPKKATDVNDSDF
jgi:regulator of replication initiation timing